MLNLRIVRGPLQPVENATILSEYNRLKSSRIPMNEFLRWVQNSPEGPAWHAILEKDSVGIVGHQCLIPLRANCGDRRIIAAKSEYTFLHEDFQTTRIRGFEGVRRPTHIVAAGQLFQHCQAKGWGPILMSAVPALHRWGRTVGCEATNFPGWECLLVLRPWKAATKTPNLLQWQRTSLGLTGVVQRIGWSSALFVSSQPAGIRSVSVGGCPLPRNGGSLSFFEDPDSLRWRYPTEQYERLALGANDDQFVIVKGGSTDGYSRVCQYGLGPDQPSLALITSLVRLAKEHRTIGLRWTVYGDSLATRKLVRRMRVFGFLCVPRVRTLLIHDKEKEFLDAQRWNLFDAMFSFHA